MTQLIPYLMGACLVCGLDIIFNWDGFESSLNFLDTIKTLHKIRIVTPNNFEGKEKITK